MSATKKLSSAEKLPLVVVACQVLQDMLERLMPPDLADQVSFMDYGLHRFPSKMTWTLQDVIDAIEEPSLVVLGYGLCGNGLNGIKAGKHTLLVPRADDCIAILLGSRQAYMREFESTPGTYYLSKGWLESGSHPLKEYHEYVEKYGAKDAAWIMDQQYQNYERLVLVTHSQADMDAYRAQAQEVADYCQQWGMRYEEILGSDRYVRDLVETAARLREASDPSREEAGDNKIAGDDFVIIPPGGEIRQSQFI